MFKLPPHIHLPFKPGRYSCQRYDYDVRDVDSYSRNNYGRPHWRRICRMPCF